MTNTPRPRTVRLSSRHAIAASVVAAVVLVLFGLLSAGGSGSGHGSSDVAETSRPSTSGAPGSPSQTASSAPTPSAAPASSSSPASTPASASAPASSASPPPSSAAPSSPAPPPPLDHLLGVHEGPDWSGGVTDFTTSLGRSPSVVISYEDSSSWHSIAHPDWALSRYNDSQYRVVLGVPMLPKDSSTTLRAGAQGAYDSYFADLGRTLMAHRAVHAILRIGWEMNGNFYRWSWGANVAGGNPSYSYKASASANAADFRAYFRRIVQVLRATPGQGFTIDWGTTLGSGPNGAPVEAAYPGDDVVDIIGADAYDAIWERPMSAEQRWERLVHEGGGLAWQASFAAQHHKLVSFPEWGLSNVAWQNGGGGGDDPYFITQMAQWIASHNVGYQSYYDVDNPAGNEQHRLADFPSGSARYHALFG